ncbi:hypothetical protein QBC32DRAFT_392167 [Pseudoneurospora amorphoporcata]|uniref:Nephrocystin 3-like N-terminal domain-containing protein n=1 Tax=Pseudoneurospora amorphoporcata TaxID=241081 RepID=A0AAN6NIJ7_9PEZI|nr:hypothetical protein QBC32DRAFT_392167 [Pseudoneurospora amorphoporcata]
MKRSWSFYNSGSGFFAHNTGSGTLHSNNAVGEQYNATGPQYNHFNYYESPFSRTDQERERLEREKNDCLRSLSFNAIHIRRDKIPPAHPSTCEWIRETAKFRQWRDRTDLSRHNAVLWIKGHPGTGKSTLMKHIWSYCQRELQARTTAAYFFHARGDLLEKTPLGMIRSLVCQLLMEEESTYQHFLPLFRRKKQLHIKLEWGEAELQEFLLSEMQTYQGKPLVLLVDALDECSELQVQDVVDFLELLSITYIRHGLNVSICLSSRHYPNM